MPLEEMSEIRTIERYEYRYTQEKIEGSEWDTTFDEKANESAANQTRA